MQVRLADEDDRERRAEFLERWHSVRVARREGLEYPLDHPAFVVEEGNRIVAMLTYVIRGSECEILTLHSDERLQGIGTELINRVRQAARDAGCTRLWVLTTNDNVDALRFYQRRGFSLSALRPGAVDQSRAALKPEIPEAGNHGIAIRDEIELETRL